MAEYIERETAITTIMSEPPDAHYPHWYADKIKAIPAADVAPVARCKDCKYWHKETLFCDYMPCGEARERVNWYDDDFCS